MFYTVTMLLLLYVIIIVCSNAHNGLNAQTDGLVGGGVITVSITL